MSTSETVVFEAGVCPCGTGHIAKHVTTQDNPWSTADIYYSIECGECDRQWRLEYGGLVLRASESAYVSAKSAEDAAREPLRALVERLVADYFADFGARTKKDEHAEMVRLNITSRSYRQYLEHRRQGGTPATACYGLGNLDWLSTLAAERGLDAKLDELRNQYEAAQETTNGASRAIVRRKL